MLFTYKNKYMWNTLSTEDKQRIPTQSAAQSQNRWVRRFRSWSGQHLGHPWTHPPPVSVDSAQRCQIPEIDPRSGSIWNFKSHSGNLEFEKLKIWTASPGAGNPCRGLGHIHSRWAGPVVFASLRACMTKDEPRNSSSKMVTPILNWLVIRK